MPYAYSFLTRFSLHFLHPVSYRAHVAQAAVQPFPIVKHFDVVEQIILYFFNTNIFFSIKLLSVIDAIYPLES